MGLGKPLGSSLWAHPNPTLKTLKITSSALGSCHKRSQAPKDTYEHNPTECCPRDIAWIPAHGSIQQGLHPELHLALGEDTLGILDLQILTMGSQESGGWVFR